MESSGYLPGEAAAYLEDRAWHLQRGHSPRIRKLQQQLSTLPKLKSVMVILYWLFYGSHGEEARVTLNNRWWVSAYQPYQERHYIIPENSSRAGT